MAGVLDKENTIASPGFNRWLVPPAALAVHLSIGMAYGFSVFWKPLGNVLKDELGNPIAACAAGATTFGDKLAGTAKALFATDCNWTQFDLGWMFTLFFVLLGCSAALFGGWLEREGPRKTGVVSAVLWAGGLLISAAGIYLHQLWLLWLGSGIIGGIGLGLGYISPVSTLIKWFPDHRGMATGMAIMGFGGGAMIGSPIATKLMAYFSVAGAAGVWQTFVVLGVIYFIFMLSGSFGYRIPATGWKPANWNPPVTKDNAMIATKHVHLNTAHKTPQFWLLWIVLCMNVSACIGILGAASPMLQETFGGALIGQAQLGFIDVKADDGLSAAAALVGAGFVGLISVFNIFGRIGWASSSDRLGRKRTYFIFFVLGAVLYCTAAYVAGFKSLSLFVACFCIISSMYGGGFATIPAYLADMFGTQFVGAIHGRLLTAWSTAGIIGPVVVNYMHDTRLEAGVPYEQIYAPIMLVLAGMMVIGFVANMLIKPVADKYFMTDAELDAVRSVGHAKVATKTVEMADADKNSLVVILAWGAVLIPIAYGIWSTAQKAWSLFS
ncbi:MAG: OFA family MFS transporter [Methylophilaceae bacterium]|nr:OFA family MFS transporter [Methylophilaceae bacterium]MDG1445774.1 OFA family MFS transporter [Methylophilaceae bacterium]